MRCEAEGGGTADDGGCCDGVETASTWPEAGMDERKENAAKASPVESGERAEGESSHPA